MLVLWVDPQIVVAGGKSCVHAWQVGVIDGPQIMHVVAGAMSYVCMLGRLVL